MDDWWNDTLFSSMAVADSVDIRFAPFCLIVCWLIHLASTFTIVNVGSKLVVIFWGWAGNSWVSFHIVEGEFIQSKLLCRVLLCVFVVECLKIKSYGQKSCLPSTLTAVSGSNSHSRFKIWPMIIKVVENLSYQYDKLRYTAIRSTRSD